MHNRIVARVELIASALGISDAEVDAALIGDRNLIQFANRYNQSLDWIIDGDVRGMIISRARIPAHGKD